MLGLGQNYVGLIVTSFIDLMSLIVMFTLGKIFVFKHLRLVMWAAVIMQTVNACFDFQCFVLSDHFMTKTASIVNYVVKAATKTRKAGPAAKHVAREW